MTGRGCCGQRGSTGSQNNGQQRGKRCVTDSHREDVCHGTNERRRDLIDQVKIFLDDFDDRPCPSPPPQSAAGGLRPLGEYPEYLRKHCQSWMPDPQPPNITSNGTHEVRVTSDYERAKKEQSEYVSYVDANAGRKSIPPSCECAKRNGLQDQCSRPECSPPTPQCLATNPGPCCPPSLGMSRKEAAQAITKRPSPQTTYQQDFQYRPEEQNVGGKDPFKSVYKDDYCPTGANTPPSPSPWQVQRQGQDECQQCGNNQPAYPGQRKPVEKVVAVGVYKTVYNNDYGTPQGSSYAVQTTSHPPMQSSYPGKPNSGQRSPTGTSPQKPDQKMMCFTPLPPSSMPSGKKYLCCPLPE